MASETQRSIKALRIVRYHGRLFAAAAAGIVIAATVPGQWGMPTRFLFGWDAFALIYLVLAFLVIRAFDIHRVQVRAEEQDEGAALLLVLVVAAAVASIAAIVVVLGAAAEEMKAFSFALAATTALLSWTLIHTVFMFHYTHIYYRGPGIKGDGLKFPEDEQPSYWDFVYFSFVIGMTFQVSDVQVTGKLMRKLVVAHGVLSFLFNVAILALTVNLGANLF
jgi:uncharacterized membrane protein